MVLKKVMLPEGVQDLLIDDCIYRRKIEGVLMESFNSWGYMEVSSPTLEYYDLFSFDYLSRYGDKMFKLIDTKGSLLVLRPDCTIPIARMVATKMKDFVYPLKLCYIEDVYRFDQEQSGKKREYRQAGVELFGVQSYRADAEVILTAIESLKKLGLEDFIIEIGQLKLLKGILDNIQITETDNEKLLEAIGNKNLTELGKLIYEYDIDEGIRIILQAIPSLYGKPQEVVEALNKLPLTEEMKASVEELEMIFKTIQAYGYGEYITFDLGMISQLGYYTGIIFKGYTKDLGEVLCSGGRYDKLLEDFGMKCPATGFAFIINKITKALKLQENLTVNKKRHYLIIDSLHRDSIIAELMKRLKKEECIVEVSLLKESKDIENYCSKRNIDEIWKINEDGTISTIVTQEV